MAPMRQNFEQVRLLEHDDETLARLALLEEWTEAQFASLAGPLAARKAAGFVREGHGDLHLGNIAMAGADPIIFDGIEFSCTLRCIDVMNDVAFLVMDLEHRARPDLAAWFVNAYLEESGDYGGLPLLSFYMVYRAMVRAKVAALRLHQLALPPEQMRPLHDEFLEYVALAERLAVPMRGALLITHGVSGAGKTVVTGELVGALGAVRVRSDVERKRLAGLAADARTGAAPDAGIYTPQATDATYRRLAAAAREILASGRIAIVDATFLERDRRHAFAGLARERELPFLILDLEAPEPLLRERVAGRAAAGRDASEAGAEVLAAQLARREPLDKAELERTVTVRPDAPVEVGQIRRLVRS
jgi:predicted kinase